MSLEKPDTCENEHCPLRLEKSIEEIKTDIKKLLESGVVFKVNVMWAWGGWLVVAFIGQAAIYVFEVIRTAHSLK